MIARPGATAASASAAILAFVCLAGYFSWSSATGSLQVFGYALMRQSRMLDAATQTILTPPTPVQTIDKVCCDCFPPPQGAPPPPPPPPQPPPPAMIQNNALLLAVEDKMRAEKEAEAARKAAKSESQKLAASRKKQKQQARVIARLKEELHAVKSSPRERPPQTYDFSDAVRAAATERKEVMLAVANLRAVISLLPLLLLSMRLVPAKDISQHLVVQVDSAPALQACRRLHTFCTIQPGLANSSAAASGTADFGTSAFYAINWRGIELARQLLLEGYTVLNVDVDVGLTQNPFDYSALRHNNTGDFVAARDSPGEGQFNSGFIMYRPTARAIALLSHMLELLKTPAVAGFASSEQVLLNRLVDKTQEPPLSEAAKGIVGVELDGTAFRSLCQLSYEGSVLPDQTEFAHRFGARLEQEGGYQRLLGVHMNCCAWRKAAGSDVPRDCKLALLTAVLQWQAHHAASQQHALSVWVN